ncbi:MAG: DUF3164 family protein [Proteobacteria bacterium]|nr:DUF3164 family protein [Pseudomonadota bacterium]MBU1648214.1 DUF3164 family protein [Pseudomonadota bacterium]
MANKNTKGHWLNASGDAVPVKYVPVIDKKRDMMIERLFKRAEEASKRLGELRAEVDREVAEFLTMAAAEHNLVPNDGGNYWFTGFSGDKRLEIKVGKLIDFDEHLKWAKQKIDQCIEKWSEGANDKLRLIVFDAFKADSKGRLDTKRILGLKKLKIKDPVWEEAMELIGKALVVTGTKTYVNFYRRGAHDAWVGICLDMARV